MRHSPHPCVWRIKPTVLAYLMAADTHVPSSLTCWQLTQVRSSSEWPRISLQPTRVAREMVVKSSDGRGSCGCGGEGADAAAAGADALRSRTDLYDLLVDVAARSAEPRA